MRPHSEIMLLVMAAGEASRMGSIKQLLPVFGIPLIDYQVRRWRFVFHHDPIIVTGAYSEEINNQSDLKKVTWVYNENWKNGLGSSIVKGMEACAQSYLDTKACLLILLDQVNVGPSHLIELIEAWHKRPDLMLASEFHHTIGPPVIFPRKYWANLRQINHKSGAGSFLYKHTDLVRKYLLPEAVFDLDSPLDYEYFLSALKNPKISRSNN